MSFKNLHLEKVFVLRLFHMVMWLGNVKHVKRILLVLFARNALRKEITRAIKYGSSAMLVGAVIG